MMRVLVTGGAGFIGSHLVDRLLERGDYVAVVDNFDDFYSPAAKRANLAAQKDNKRLQVTEADIRNADAIESLMANSRFDCIVHLAARAGVRPSIQNPLDYVDTNVRGTYVLLEAARRHGIGRFIFGSSSSVYGTTSRVPFDENDRLTGPISPYAATKIAGEAACHVYSELYRIRTVCLRFFTVYGPRQRPDLAIHKFARLITRGEPIPVFGDGTSRRDYTHIGDTLSGILAAIEYDGALFDVFNLGESQTVELRRLIALLEKRLGATARIEWLPAQPGDVPLTHANIDKARQLLGYSPKVGIEEGINKFVTWFLAHTNQCSS
jgi:UDP-glucuronate 4-epimerase